MIYSSFSKINIKEYAFLLSAIIFVTFSSLFNNYSLNIALCEQENITILLSLYIKQNLSSSIILILIAFLLTLI
jgi:hypothetical protein